MTSIILELSYTILAITGCYLVMKKKRWGWMLWLIATPLIIASLVFAKKWFLIPAFFIYGYIDWLGWTKWRNK